MNGSFFAFGFGGISVREVRFFVCLRHKIVEGFCSCKYIVEEIQLGKLCYRPIKIFLKNYGQNT